MNDVVSWKCWGFGGFEKKQLVEIQTWARPDDFVRYGRRAFDEEIVCLSLRMSKNLKLEKVIKSFVPEPISSFFFSDSYEHYEHFMNIMSISRVHIWLCNNNKSPQVSRTFLNILPDLYSDVFRIVLIHPPISNSSSLLFKTLEGRSNCAYYNWYHSHPHVPQLS